MCFKYIFINNRNAKKNWIVQDRKMKRKTIENWQLNKNIKYNRKYIDKNKMSVNIKSTKRTERIQLNRQKHLKEW